MSVFIGLIRLAGLYSEGDDTVLACLDVGNDVTHSLVLAVNGAGKFGNERAASFQSLEVSRTGFLGREYQ